MTLFNLFFSSIFTENILLTFFLGMCSFIACSKKTDTAIGMGISVTLVLIVTTPINWVVYNFFLKTRALNWASINFLKDIDLSFLTYIVFIALIASSVQILEIVIEKFFPYLHNAFGVYLPLIAVNCAVLGVSLLAKERELSFLESTIFALGSGLGWLMAISIMASINKKIRYANIPEGLKGTGITFIIAGLLALVFSGFKGI